MALSIPSHRPRLLFSPEKLAAFKNRIAETARVRDAWRARLKRLEATLTDAVELPPRGGNWPHWYASPDTGVNLRTGDKIGPWEWKHYDPSTGKEYVSSLESTSTDYDGVVISSVHHGNARDVRDLGLAYGVTGDEQFAEKAREIALAYTDHYLSYPRHTNHDFHDEHDGARLMSQTLDEATWMIPFAQGVDFIWNTLSVGQISSLTEQLLQPSAREIIMAWQGRVHNITCWRNSAALLVGLLVDDEDLVEAAIDRPEGGYWQQMREGVSEDGTWWEGAWSYHFYTLSALWPGVVAADNCGINLECPELKGMYDAPIALATPSMKLPAFNDSREVDLSGQASAYEIAYARYKEPAYLRVLAGSDRTSEHALWFGVPDLPEPPLPVFDSKNQRSSGYAILATGDESASQWACLKYGPHGGGHGHPDKLNFVLYTDGSVLVTDPGTCSYGLDAKHGWYTRTIAHNTLVVDQTSQEPVQGNCIAFGKEAGVSFCSAEAGEIYSGVHFVRSLFTLDRDRVVVIDQIRCTDEHTMDLAYHQIGTWKNRPYGEEWDAPTGEGYDYLRDTRLAAAMQECTASTEREDGTQMHMNVQAFAPMDVISGDGPGVSLEDRVPCLIVRRKDREFAVAWLISREGSRSTLKLYRMTTKERNLSPSVACGVVVDGFGLLCNPQKAQIDCVLDGVPVKTREPVQLFRL